MVLYVLIASGIIITKIDDFWMGVIGAIILSWPAAWIALYCIALPSLIPIGGAGILVVGGLYSLHNYKNTVKFECHCGEIHTASRKQYESYRISGSAIRLVE